MREINDGGPAFPGEEDVHAAFHPGVSTVRNPGMSLRDWFAGQALAGMVANPSQPWMPWPDVVIGAYAAADAMLAARRERKS